MASIAYALPRQCNAAPSLPERCSTVSTLNDLEASGPATKEAEQNSLECSTLASDDDSETPSLSTSRLFVIHTALVMCLFLATTDATLVSTSLPTIAADLQGGNELYSWVGVAYLLTQTAFQPLAAKLADILGRKPVLYASILVFMVSSILCGASKTMLWLVIARAFAGLGGAGIVPVVWVVMSDIVPQSRRPKWQNFLSLTWSLSAVSGPLLGGLFSDKVSWRWGFYVNVPIGAAACAVLWVSLNGTPLPGPIKGQHWKDTIRRFDYAGLTLLLSGTITLLIGLNLASHSGWGDRLALGLLCVGGVILVLTGWYEVRTTQDALIPPRIFKTRTTVTILVMSFFQTFAYTAGTFYLVLYYQAVQGANALMAGLLSLPYSLGSALISTLASQYVQHTQRYREVIICGLGLSTLGFGLMITLDERSTRLTQEVLPLIAGLGLGLLFKTPHTALEAAMRDKDRAGSVGNFFLVRFIGSTTGLAIAGAIFQSQVVDYLPSDDFASFDWRTVGSLEPPDLRNQVLKATARAISMIWIVCTPCLGVSFILSFFMRHYDIETKPLTPSKKSSTDSESVSTTHTLPEKQNDHSLIHPNISIDITTLPKRIIPGQKF